MFGNPCTAAQRVIRYWLLCSLEQRKWMLMPVLYLLLNIYCTHTMLLSTATQTPQGSRYFFLWRIDKPAEFNFDRPIVINEQVTCLLVFVTILVNMILTSYFERKRKKKYNRTESCVKNRLAPPTVFNFQTSFCKHH